jgi:putative transposase
VRFHIVVGATLRRPKQKMQTTLNRRKNVRLKPEAYLGNGKVIHMTMCAKDKKPLFAASHIAAFLNQEVISISKASDVKIYAYVVMPDHLHVLASLGRWGTPGAYVKHLKGNLSEKLRTHFNLQNVWQRGFYDHVMRDEENVKQTAEYILNNPVRKGLAENWRKYPWCGSHVFHLA